MLNFRSEGIASKLCFFVRLLGFLSAIQKIAGHLGILISFSLGAYLDWRQLAMLVSVAPMMLFVTVIYVPETPSFLVLKGRDEEAYR